MEGINRDRGCTIRLHPAGFRVVMYKDDPGVYLSERAEPLSDKVAEAAGFDIAGLDRERRKRARLAEYKAQVEAEFATQEEDLERVMSVPTEGLHVKHIGGGKYAILNSEGTRVTQNPLTKEDAQELINDMTGGQEDGEAS